MTEKHAERDYDMELEISDFREMGCCVQERVAFIKGDMQDGKFLWGIYDEEGARMAVTDSREFAFVIAKQNDFVPHSVH